MEKIAAAALGCWLALGGLGHAQTGASAWLYRKVPDFHFASATLPGHSLEELGLKYRKLVVFASGPDDALLKQQLQLLAAPEVQAGMRDRDMVMIPVLRQGSLASALAAGRVDPAASWQVASAYGIQPGAFAALLVGRTGVVKACSDKPFDPAFLFELVDSLPMRRHEMSAAPQMQAAAR